MSETQMLAHKRAVDADRKAQAMLRQRANRAPATVVQSMRLVALASNVNVNTLPERVR